MEKFMNKIILSVVVVLLLSTACGSLKNIDYQFGDISRVYCGTTNEEIRGNLKATLSGRGIKIGVDYCSSAGLVDALLIQPIQQAKE